MDIVISCDPGNKGAISIYESENTIPKIFDMPLIKIIKATKDTLEYDLEKIVSILEPYKDKKVVFVLEKVGVMPNEGAVSSFNFGKGIGQLQGIAKAFKFELCLVTPQLWKKAFSELETSQIESLIEQGKKIKDQIKDLKNQKDKAKKKENNNKIKIFKKDVDKIGRAIKTAAKAQARTLAAKKYPSISDSFELVKHDGRAESVLIGLWYINTQNEKFNELVQ
jgi:hypothetical protein